MVTRKFKYLSPEWAEEVLIMADACEAMSKFPLAIEEI